MTSTKHLLPSHQIKLNDKEKLILEILACKWIIGETSHIFDDTLNSTLKKLAFKKLIMFKYGKTRNTTQAWFTDYGQKVVFSTPKYYSLSQKLKKKKK